MQTLGCSKAWGSSSHNIPLTHFSTNPTVVVSWPEMILTIPPSNVVSVGSVLPKAKADGDSILIQAKYTLREKPRTMHFNLAKLGIKKERLPFLKVFWINPGGTKTPLPVEIKTKEGK
jgi:hypothetical protein